MESSALSGKQTSMPGFLAGGGEMGQRMREFDWSSTPLGPIDTWPQSLRTCVRIMLTSRQPIWIGWGKELIKLYNDPYKAIVGGKHPWALGKPASVVWKDIWRDIEPLLSGVMNKDEGSFSESQLLIMERNGYAEETYYTFSYTPVPGDEGGTAGMLCANTDDTERIISERQLKTLTGLGQYLNGVQTSAEVISRTIATLQENPHDFPFTAFYSFQENKAVLSRHSPMGDIINNLPPIIDLQEQGNIATLFNTAAVTRQQQVFEKLREVIGNMPQGAWEQSPDKAMVLPILQAASKEPYGFLVVGLNPYRLADEKYKSFFSLIADQVATSFADVHLLEEERKRAEALAEIDRAKTIFFSNISHEFRTPLTLLLGPIEDTLNHPEDAQATRARMEVAYRNVLRMQKLVNTLLEFSRIEAGRVEGRFSRVDITALTQDLASSFRSAVEKAGMALSFQGGAIEAEVYVDAEMWERIVLNLVSNAFKYTKQGSIHISIKQEDNQLLLTVTDTGVGIPAEQLSKIFDRFHRVENMEGRSQEGTGIGLAMVKELVKIHQGTIVVSSEPGKGSSFTVAIPVGKAHLPSDKIIADLYVPGATHIASFVEEAMKWIPGGEEQHPSPGGMYTGTIQASVQNDGADATNKTASDKKFTVLLADDNADMRLYVNRLLAAQFEVVTAIDGLDAWQKTLTMSPDLVLSDIMMPKLDGFGLVEKIRSHPDSKDTPVIFLSARAGEEARVEGLEAGANDYLVKPFSAKELLATVNANIKIARSRLSAENNMKNVFRQAPVAMCIFRGPDLILELANERALQLWGKRYEDLVNRPVLESFPEIVEQGFDKILKAVYDTGEAYVAYEMPIMLIRHGKPENMYVNFIYEPLRNERGEVDGIVGVATDVTVQVMARRKIEENEKELNELANAMAQLVWITDEAGKVLYFNNRVTEFLGVNHTGEGNWDWMGMVHPDDQAVTRYNWKQALRSGTVFQAEQRLHMKDGSYRWHLSRTIPQRDQEGNIVKWFGTATDIHISREHANMLEYEVEKRTSELNDLNNSLQQSNNDLQQFAHVASHDLKEPLRKIKTFAGRLEDDTQSVFSDKAKTYISKVNSATNRMYNMIEGVLNYSVLNGAEHTIQQVDLNEILNDIEADLELPIESKSANIRYHNLPVIEGATVLLYQLFYNLINNSLKFSRENVPPIISITAKNIAINQKAYMEICIEDNGIGFEQAYAEKIFDTFARLNSKDQYEGTGLGLALCKKIVQRHGGTIKAKGKRNEGTTFMVQLPVRQERDTI